MIHFWVNDQTRRLVIQLLMRSENHINQVMRYALKGIFASAERVANHTPLNTDGLPRYARSWRVMVIQAETPEINAS